MPPSSAYVSPLAKSIRRFDSSASALCRLRITGIECLNLSAICCASLKLRGRTRCTRTEPGLFGTAAICRTERLELLLEDVDRGAGGGAAAGSSDSVQSSYPCERRLGVSRRTLGRSR